MKNKTPETIFILVLLLCSSALSAQYYSSGADPASIKWQQINTPRFRFVFPSEFQTPATKLAHYMDSIAPHVEGVMHHRPRKINVLIHGRSNRSNGFVSWAPKRIELFPNPAQDLYSTDWLEHLGTHEYRHVVQIDKLNQGFTRLLGYLTGQQATGAVLGIFFPMWLLEGDAVVTETTLTSSGRGRLPFFSQSLRARLSTYGTDSFDKAYLGSYTDFVPDYYKMGYHFISRLRDKYGSSVVSDLFEYTGRNSWSLTPIRHSLKKNTGMGPKKLYDKTFNELALEWQLYDKNLKPSPYHSITQPADNQTNYQYPVILPDNHIITLVSGPGQRQRIEEITTEGDHHILAYTGIRNDEPFTANNRWVVWSENKPHPRWTNAGYSVLRVLDRNTKKTTTIGDKKRYYAPCLKAGSDTLVVIESTPAYHFYITTISLATGAVIKRIATPSNAFPLHPSWSDQPNEIVCLLLTDSGKKIVSLNPNLETWDTLRPAAFDEPRYPLKRGSLLWFSASTPNAEEIFRLDLSSNTCQQVTRARFGATSPSLSPDKQTLYYTDYTPCGYQLVSVSTGQTTVNKGVTPSNLNTPLIQELISQEKDTKVTVPTNIESNTYKTRPYSKFNLINLHSWAPANISIDDEAINPGITLMSQNLLGTATTTLGYNASPSHSREKFQVGFTWSGWYPILNLDIKWGDHHENFDENGIYQNQNDFFSLQQIGKNGKHLSIESGLKLPLTFNKGPWFRMLQPGARLSWQKEDYPDFLKTFYTQDDDGQFINTGITHTGQIFQEIDYWAMEYSLYFHNILRGTSRDVGSRFGQSAEVIYRHSPWGNYEAGQAMACITRLHFPGLGRHHAITMTNSWQKKNKGDKIQTSEDINIISYQRFNNMIDPARGYHNLRNDNMYLFRSSYKMPLWNPDVSLANLAYIKRFRLNLFFDATRTSYEVDYKDNTPSFVVKNTYTSAGWELMADFHLFRFVLPFSAGYRGGYRNADNTFFHEAIFSTSFGSFLVE